MFYISENRKSVYYIILPNFYFMWERELPLLLKCLTWVRIKMVCYRLLSGSGMIDKHSDYFLGISEQMVLS